MFVPPPNGMTTASASSAARRTRGDLVLAAGAHDDVGQPPELAAPVADEVAQALAAGMDDPVQRVRRHVLGADGALERRAQRRRQRRLGDLERVEGDRRRGRRVEVQLEVAPEERRQLGLVLVGERDALVAPAPPLHPAATARNRQREGPRRDFAGARNRSWMAE